ncbi:MAG: hypothetical protein E6J29_02160 [Chloroflexi bacterium]|nr:MAG: hypothetical protein E6J29_02160 [Chloroflexota bacterium]TMD53206.1 MAG: hypothetical protein E6I85_08720 [Chloroflexota bacterium]
MYLVNEGTIAVGAMTAALVIAFLLVVLLGAYVVYCDAQNRVGESEFAGIGHHEDPPVVPVEPSAGGSEPAADRPARSRRARTPKES